MALPRDVFVVGAARTAIGTFGGALKDVPLADLATLAVKTALHHLRTESRRREREARVAHDDTGAKAPRAHATTTEQIKEMEGEGQAQAQGTLPSPGHDEPDQDATAVPDQDIDTTAIGQPPPAGHADRGPYYRWLFYGAGPIEAAAADKNLGVVVPADKQGMVGYGSFQTLVDTLEKAVTGKTYIAGNRFSAADLYLASHLGWLTHFGIMEKRPAFEAYMTPHLARPAAVRARAIEETTASRLPVR